MLKQRLLTAAVLIPLVVLSILFLSTNVFAWCLAGVTILAAWEWFSIIGFNTTSQKLFTFSALIFVSVLMSLLAVSTLLLVGSFIWVAISALVISFAHRPLSVTLSKLFNNKNIALVMAVVVLAFFWHGAIQLHASSDLGPKQLLFAMIVVWLADTGGYFAGKRWGKIALAKAISPNKTWEGVAGALVLGLVWALLAYSLELAVSISLFNWLVLSILALLISIVGDLFESLFKRCYNVKDSGNLLPGHGGILDRIDSLIAAVPVFAAGVYFLGA